MDTQQSERNEPQIIWQDEVHQFIWLGAGDPAEEKGIASNQYLIVDGGNGYLLDPGGYHVFDRVFENATRFVPHQDIRALFLSHQDPDICVSLVSWLEFCPEATVFVSRLWERFITHLAIPTDPRMQLIPDEGGSIQLPSGDRLMLIPAHFLHSPGNFHVYDPRARILFTGDLGAALVPEDKWSLYAEDFTEHVHYMEGFHRRYLSSTRALRTYLDRIRDLEIDCICPQHGCLINGDNVRQMFEWLAGLEVGIDFRAWGDRG